MNKKELTKKLMNRMQNFGYFPSFTNVKTFIQEYEKLTKSEPQKPVIPQSVSDWIEKCKTVKAFAVSLSFALHPSVWEVNGLSNETIEWLMDAENQDLFARAWLYGYKIEKEERYEVILCNGQSLKTVYRQGSDHFDFKMVYGTPEKFTKKQLEDAGFGWVFSCEGVEIEEVD